MVARAGRVKGEIAGQAHAAPESPTASPASAVTPQEMAGYRARARQRSAQQRQVLEARRQAAWRIAYQAAALLKADYGVRRVVIFGSLARGEPLSPHSDLDLVVWGLDEGLYYRAVSRLLDLDPSIPIDLLRSESLDGAILAKIEAEGIPL